MRALTDLESEESDLQCNVAVRHTDPGKLRKLYAELEREKQLTKQIDTEWGQLQIEQSTWSMHSHIEKVASARLRMAVEAAFTKADANGDGRISKEEASKLPDIAARFEMLDKDKDGSLTLAEFAAGYKAG